MVATLLFWHHLKHPSDTTIRQKLPGTWVWQKYNMRFTITFATNGSFQSQLVFGYSKSSRTDQIGGTWQIKDGIYTSTITNDSNERHQVPRTSSGRIIVPNSDEFVLVSKDSTNNEVWKRVSQ
jgi:hypothetical protein